MSINKAVLVQLKDKKNKNCLRALEDLHEKSFYTIKEWIKNDHPQLSTIDSLNTISAYLDLSIDDIVISKTNLPLNVPQH